MQTHVLPERIEDNFGAPLHRLFELLDVVQGLGSDTLLLDYSEARFTHPFLTAGISGLKEAMGLQLLVPSDAFKQSHIQEYMNVVTYPDGVKYPYPYPGNTHTLKQELISKTYIPILNFPTDSSTQSEEFRDELISAFEALLIEMGHLSGETLYAVKWLISEGIDNMVEHAQVASGKIFAQAFPTKQYLDLCLLDMGRTLLETYQEDDRGRYSDVNDDLKAIKAAANGKSTKDYANSRGYGISDSRGILTTGLGGHFFMMSGNAWFYQNIERAWSGPLPRRAHWPGHYIAVRIPLIEKPGFVLNNFISR